jgi:hypothetical protein
MWTSVICCNILSRDKVLQIICRRNALRLGSSEKVLHNWIRVVSEGDFNWPFKTMYVSKTGVRKLLDNLEHWDSGSPVV